MYYIYIIDLSFRLTVRWSAGWSPPGRQVRLSDVKITKIINKTETILIKKILQTAFINIWLVEEEPAYTAAYPGLRTEKVTLRLKDGRVLSKAVDLPVGRPPYDFIEKKFFSLAEMTVTHDCAVTLRDTVFTLADRAPVRQLGNAIRTLRRK